MISRIVRQVSNGCFSRNVLFAPEPHSGCYPYPMMIEKYRHPFLLYMDEKFYLLCWTSK